MFGHQTKAQMPFTDALLAPYDDNSAKPLRQLFNFIIEAGQLGCTTDRNGVVRGFVLFRERFGRRGLRWSDPRRTAVMLCYALNQF
jgi:hypothetical protein